MQFFCDLLPQLVRLIKYLSFAINANQELDWGLTMTYFLRMLGCTKGATAIEYGLIAALIAVAAVTAMGTLGNKISQTMNNSTVDMK